MSKTKHILWTVFLTALFFLITFLFPGMLRGAEYKVLHEVAAQYHPADVKIRFDAGGHYDSGSATVIESNKHGSMLISAWHVARDVAHKHRDPKTGKQLAIPGELYTPSGEKYSCRFFAWSSGPDIMVGWTNKYKIPNPRRMRYDFSKSTEPYYLTGYPHGKGPKTKKLSFLKDNVISSEYRGNAISGHSGGAITDSDGYLVGVVSAADHNSTVGFSGNRLRNWLFDCATEYQMEYKQCSGGRCGTYFYGAPRVQYGGGYYIQQQPVQRPQQPVQRPENEGGNWSPPDPNKPSTDPVEPENPQAPVTDPPVAGCDCGDKWDDQQKINAEVLNNFQTTLEQLTKISDISEKLAKKDVAIAAQVASIKSLVETEIGQLQQQIQVNTKQIQNNSETILKQPDPDTGNPSDSGIRYYDLVPLNKE